MMDTTTAIVTIAVSIVGSGGLATLVQFLINRRDHRRETDKCLLRSNILATYHRYKECKEIPMWDKENLLMMYQQYKRLNGNSFVESVMKEAEQWKVV